LGAWMLFIVLEIWNTGLLEYWNTWNLEYAIRVAKKPSNYSSIPLFQ